MKLKAQPIKFKSMYDFWTQKPVMAAEAWVKGPSKPREVLRDEEAPPEDMSLETLQEKGIVEIAEPLRVQAPKDLENVPEDVDFFIVGETENLFVQDAILEKLISLDRPILAEWDKWGYSWFGRLSKLRFGKFSEARYFNTAGSDDLKALLNAIRAWKRIRTLRVIYIGEVPSHSVVSSDKGSDFGHLMELFGTDFVNLDYADYTKAVDGVSDSDVEGLVKEWKEKYAVTDGRGEKLKFYAKIYLGLKGLLGRYNANAVTADCAWLPDVDYVPCFAFSLLADEGVVVACEGDIPALYIAAALMGASGKPVMMGNLNANATHEDIENNIITVNHDVVPPSMGCSTCRLKLRDFHATGKGLTPYVDLENMPVTIAGMHWDMDKICAAKGTIRWTKDTTHCRITVGIEVERAKEVHKSSFGHHQVLAYGDHTKTLKGVARLFGVEYVEL